MTGLGIWYASLQPNKHPSTESDPPQSGCTPPHEDGQDSHVLKLYFPTLKLQREIEREGGGRRVKGRSERLVVEWCSYRDYSAIVVGR